MKTEWMFVFLFHLQYIHLLFFLQGGTFESRTNMERSNLLSLWTEVFSQLLGQCSYYPKKGKEKNRLKTKSCATLLFLHLNGVCATLVFAVISTVKKKNH